MSEQLEVEEQARAQGWVPESEYRGDSGKHKTAEEFLEVGEKIQGVQRERNDKLLNEIRSLKNQVGGYQETVNGFRSTHEKEMAVVKLNAYNKAKADLQAERRQAVSEADVDKVEIVQEKIDNLEKPTTGEGDTNTSTNTPDPEFVEWGAKNPWYAEDETMRDYADFIGEKISKNGMATQATFYAVLMEKVKAQFPDKFPKKKEETQDVEASSPGSSTSTSKGGKSYKDLPDDAKKACDRYIKDGVYKNREDYVKIYPF